MATTLYFRDALATIHDAQCKGLTGYYDNLKIVKALSPNRGSSAKYSQEYVASYEYPVGKQGSQYGCWIWVSPPIDQDITISGNVTANIRALESSMSANAYVYTYVGWWKQDILFTIPYSSGAKSTFCVPNTGNELSTSETAQNATADATDQALHKGDRIVAWVTYVGATPYTMNFYYDGPTAGQSGDSYITFTETFGFLETAPTGTKIYFTNVDADVTVQGSTSKKMWKERGDGVVSLTDTFFQDWSPVDPQDIGAEWFRTNGEIVAEQVTEIAAGTPGVGDQVPYLDHNTDRVAQSFTPDHDCWIYSAAMCVYTVGGGTSDVDVAIKEDNGSNRPGSTLYFIDSTTGYLWLSNAGVSQPYGLNRLREGNHDEKAGFLAQSGHKYWFELDSGVTDSLNYTTTRGSGGTVDRYTGGSRIGSTNGGSSWTDYSNQDWGFRIFAGKILDFYTPPLAAFTLSGLVRAHLRLKEGAANSYISPRVVLYTCNNDASSYTIWGGAQLYNSSHGEIATSETAYDLDIAGPTRDIADGERILIRVFFDDTAQHIIGTDVTMTMYFNGDTADASGDAWLQFTETVSDLKVDAATTLVDLQSSGTEAREITDAATSTVDVQASGTDDYTQGEAGYTDADTVYEALVLSSAELAEFVESATAYLTLTVSSSEVMAHDYADSDTALVDLVSSGTDYMYLPVEYEDADTVFLDIVGLGGECFSTFSGTYLLVGEDAHTRWSPGYYTGRWEADDETRWLVVEITSTRGC